ncbi:TIR domain-containing protein [Streptomyces sp. 5-8]|uniref:TIR domain-containing protein n=1 Tax=Streptomyces musisoli TaxID=2802280 RepID=A0ABS1NZA3_9ACTN|nr:MULTISPECIES: TIR domain-containing protein [Streptomyces]MBL1105011.1 TIR domain-containing protein [Streptomyces musisoli]MBY8841099.1 TIR domain-containing protein [Streptomyces sp. SP2-10]
MGEVDVLIITALKEEYEAARAAGSAGYAGHPGVAAWEEREPESLTPYLVGTYVLADGSRMTVALARPTRMGATATAPVVATLVERLGPRCLAMCGVCAGNPADVALGDVVVAELAYAYDEGKRTQDGFDGDHRQIPAPDGWVRAAQDLETTDLPSFGEASPEEARIWLMERLYAGEDPRRHPACSRYLSRASWAEQIQSLQADGLVTREGAALSLTDAGYALIEQVVYDDLEGPRNLPFAVVVGPMASGNVVVKDGLTWDRLKQWGVRSVAGLEMESAVIAQVAHRLGLSDWVVAKGVMDHADPRKDDRYKRFAARSSAEVLFKLLCRRLASPRMTGQAGATSRVRSVYVVGGVTGETTYPDYEKSQLAHVCEQLGQAVAKAGAELLVCSPFPDSADLHTVIGYVQSGVGRIVHLHSPRHPEVAEKQTEMLEMLGTGHGTEIKNWYYPGPEDDDSRGQAWLLCQIQALEEADVVISIGGRVSKTASTVLHLAEARRKPIVPFAFLGGASRRAYERRDWARVHPGLDHRRLMDRDAVADAMKIADELVTARLRPPHNYRWPPRRVFISRARPDAQFAKALESCLSGAGVTTLIGERELRPDRMVNPTIEDAVLSADLFVVLWSRSYALSRFCYDEIELALRRHEVGELQLWIVNLDGSDIVPPAARALPQAVARTPHTLVALVRELLEHAEPAPGVPRP